MAETLTPRNIGVENGQGFTALALQSGARPRRSAGTRWRARPNPLSRRLAREWAVHNKAELRIGGYRGPDSLDSRIGRGDISASTR